MRARLATDRGKSHGQWAFLSLCAEDVGDGEIVKRICALKETVGAATLGVNDALWDTLAVKMRQEIDQVEVLEQERTILADSLCFVWVSCGNAIAGTGSVRIRESEYNDTHLVA